MDCKFVVKVSLFFANKLKRTVDKGIVNMHYLNLIGRGLSKNNHHGDSRAIFK